MCIAFTSQRKCCSQVVFRWLQVQVASNIWISPAGVKWCSSHSHSLTLFWFRWSSSLALWDSRRLGRSGCWRCTLFQSIACNELQFSLGRPFSSLSSGGTCLPSSKKQLSPFVWLPTGNCRLQQTRKTSTKHVRLQPSTSVLSFKP